MKHFLIMAGMTTSEKFLTAFWICALVIFIIPGLITFKPLSEKKES